MARRRQERLGLGVRVSFERTRLSEQSMADAYEQLVPVTRRRIRANPEESGRRDRPRDGHRPGRAGRQPC